MRKLRLISLIPAFVLLSAYVVQPASAAIVLGPATPVTELNSLRPEAITHISSDGLTVVLESQRLFPRYDLYIATRSDISSPFSTPVQGPFSAINTTAFNIANGVLSSNGLELYYHSAPSGTPRPMFKATRSSVADPFGSPTNTGLGFGTSGWLRPSFMSSDDLRLYIYGDLSIGDLHLLERASINDPFSFSSFDPFVNINTGSPESFATLTPDELTVFYSANRPEGAGIWAATRSSVNDAFGAPVFVESNGGAPHVFGNTLYFSRNGDIYSAPIIMSSQPVPEPTTLATWSVLGCAGLFVGHRRRKRKNVF